MRSLLFAATFAALALPAAAAELTVTAVVDTTYCASNGTQCTVPGKGHTAVAANSTNHNPIRLFVTVSRAGAPVSGLTISNFTIQNSLLPASASSATVCTEANCGTNRFQTTNSTQQGVYSIFLDRVGSNWKRGNYMASVKVINANDTGLASVMFTIPGG